MNFIDIGTYKEDLEKNNIIILDGNVMNMLLIIMEDKYGAIYAAEYIVSGYYIIISSAYTYTLQEDLSIYGQVISSDEMVF